MNNFTAIELIVVTAVLGILARIIVPNIVDIREQAQRSRELADTRNVQTAVDMFYNDFFDYPTDIQPTKTNGEIDFHLLYPHYITDMPKLEDGKSYYVDPYGKVFLNYNEDSNFMSWLKESPMIVSDSTSEVYYGLEPPLGGVFLNYNIESKKFENYEGNTEMLTLSTVLVGESLLEAYKITGDPTFLDRAIVIGDFLSSIIIKNDFWSTSFYGISPMVKYENGSWNIDKQELYIKDSAYASRFFIWLSELTNDKKYAENSRLLLDTMISIQEIIGETGDNTDLHKINGALSEKIYPNSLEFRYYPLDIAYMVYDAGIRGYEYFQEDKYKTMADSFISFVEKSFNELGGLSSAGYPYEYITYLNKQGKFASYSYSGGYFQGQNQDQLYDGSFENSWGIEKPFSTDQFLYTALGLKQAGSPYGNILFEKSKALANKNYEFQGQYYPDGVSSSKSKENINTYLFLDLAKRYDKKIIPDVEETIFSSMDFINDLNEPYGAVVWSNGEPYVESLASAFAAQKLLTQDKSFK